MCVNTRNCPISGHYMGGYSCGYGGGGIDYECAATQMLLSIDRSLSSLCTLVKDGNITVNVVIKKA